MTQRIFKNTKILFFIGLIVSTVISGCSNFGPAPLKDGAYLRYKYISDDYSGTCEIMFTRADKRYFEVTVKDPNGLLGRPFAISYGKDSRVLVDRFMRNRKGRPFQMEALGPLWVDARTRGGSGRASIDSIFSGATTDEIKKWKKWETYVVTATAFRGAISGTWYYDTKTGFLVGLQKKNVITSVLMPNPPYWMLVGTNIEASGSSTPFVDKSTDERPEKAVKQNTPKHTHAVILKNGQSMEGVVIANEEDYVTLEVEGGTITMSKEDIKAIEPIE